MQLWVPLLAALLGGIGAQAVSVLRDWRRRRRETEATVVTAQIVDGAAIRAELWQQIHDLNQRVEGLTTRLDESHSKFLELLEQHAALEIEHRRLKAEHSVLQEQYEHVQLQLQAIRGQASSSG